MAFSDKPFDERLNTMGDKSEDAFLRVAAARDVRYYRYGFDRPPFKNFPRVPVMIRVTPDYVCEKDGSHFFVECKGAYARDVKIKLETITNMAPWQAIMPIWFFIFDSKKKRFALVNYQQLINLCADAPIDRFKNDNKEHYQIPMSKFTWEPVPKEQTDDRPKGY